MARKIPKDQKVAYLRGKEAGKKEQKRKGGTYRPLCGRCEIERYGMQERHKESKKKCRTPYTKSKGDFCILCGFIPVHSCQLDVDHINGDHSDHREENLQTLCSNCHRLKTYLNKDWE